MDVYIPCAYLVSAEEDVGSPGTGDTDSCEHHVDAVNRTWVPRKRTQPLSHFFDCMFLWWFDKGNNEMRRKSMGATIKTIRL